MQTNGNLNGRSTKPVLRSFEEAVSAARKEANESGENRYVHHGMAGFVVLGYPTPATVRVEQPKARTKQAGG